MAVRVLWIGLILAQPTSAQGTDAVRPEGTTDTEVIDEILSDWHKRQNTAATIRYDLKGNDITAKGALNHLASRAELLHDYPSSDTSCELQRTWHIDFVRGLLRKEQRCRVYQLPEDRWALLDEVALCDAIQVAYLKTIPDARKQHMHGPDQEITISTDPRAVAHLRTAADQPIFDAHGMPYLGASLVGATEVPLPPREIFVVHRRIPPNEQSPRGCVVLHTQGVRGTTDTIYEYTVDVAKDCAIVASAVYHNGALKLHARVDYGQHGVGWWLPYEWVVTSYGATNNLQQVSHITVADIAVNPPYKEAVFDIPLTAGAVVTKDGGRYRVGDDGRTLVPVMSALSEEYGTARARRIAVVGGVLLVSIGSLLAAFRSWWSFTSRGDGSPVAV